MPWQERSPMDLRMRFVTEWQSGCWTMTELCADYQVSRKTGYKWADRYERSGPSGLHDRSRRPHASPLATDPELVDRLVALRRRHPRWGAKKLLVVAARRDPQADGRAARRCVTCSRRAAWSRPADAPIVPRPRPRRRRRLPASTRCGRLISKANF